MNSVESGWAWKEKYRFKSKMRSTYRTSYIIIVVGWGNDGVLNAVYSHTMENKQKEMNQIANNHLKELYSARSNTQNMTKK